MVVFVCSTYRDLMTERQAVIEAIRKVQHEHHSMEFFGARPGSPIETCLDEVRQSDVLVVVVSYLYGSLVPNSELSYTQAEYEEGNRLEIPCLVYLRDETAPLAPKHMEQDPMNLVGLRRFKEILTARHTVARFQDASDLARRVEGDLTHFIKKMTKSTPPPHLAAEETPADALRDLEIAAQILREVLPETTPQLKNLDLASRCIPSRAVGGDYYEILEYPDGRIALIIAEVAGLGLGTALMTVSLRAGILILTEEMKSTSQLVTRLNTSFSKKNPSHRFITLFFGLIDADRGELVYCNAGHNPPFLARADGTVERLEAGGSILGVFPRFVYEEVTASIRPGDVLLLYTDGVTEATNENDEEFGDDRLATVLREHRSESSIGILDGVLQAFNEWRADTPQADDITLVVAKIKP